MIRKTGFRICLVEDRLMELSTETTRGIEYLKGIIESGKLLRLGDPRPVNQGSSFYLQVKGLGKEWDFSLSRENINDLPGTKAYHASALALADALNSRFKNVDPNFYVTQTGRLLKIDITWPPSPWMNEGGYIAASGLWVNLTDLVTQQVARCALQMTSLQTMVGTGLDPFSRPSLITNTVRSCVDAGTVQFYPTRDDLPRESPAIKMQLSGYVTAPVSITDYLAQKVWLLGFKAGSGRKETKAWIADPWDAAYLGCSEADFRQAAAVLDAQGKIVLEEDSEFASVGKILLAAEGPIKDAKKKSIGPQFRTPFNTFTANGTIGEGGSGKVLRVVDDDGAERALKYLKPDGLSDQKAKRFKNELAFCKKNTHPNIITIQDWGLAEVNGVEVPFYVMPIFPQTLRMLMKENATPETLLSAFLQILEGVEEAHKAGIWHRDLKPENVLFDPSAGRAVVTDFGIAHFAEELQGTTVQTRPHDRLANFRYAAPEQRTQALVDQRADIFSLGLILYEMFTGELLHGTQHRKIGAIHPQFAYLDPVVELMTRQSPEDRPSTILAVKTAMTLQAMPKSPEVRDARVPS